MHGNVTELVEDGYIYEYEELAVINPVNCPSESFLAASSNISEQCFPGEGRVGRVYRGGSWGSYSRFLRSASRNGYFYEYDRDSYIGFRLARVMQ